MNRFVGLVLVLALVAGAAACSSSTGPAHLRFAGVSTVSQGDQITVSTVITVTNTGSSSTQIEVSECPLTLEAFVTAPRTGSPAWKAGNAACDLMARIRQLAPGDSYDYHITRTVPSTIPSGTYYLAVNMGYEVVSVGQFTK